MGVLIEGIFCLSFQGLVAWSHAYVMIIIMTSPYILLSRCSFVLKMVNFYFESVVNLTNVNHHYDNNLFSKNQEAI